MELREQHLHADATKGWLSVGRRADVSNGGRWVVEVEWTNREPLHATDCRSAVDAAGTSSGKTLVSYELRSDARGKATMIDSSARVFVLALPARALDGGAAAGTPKKLFYWMQEPDALSDQYFMAELNRICGGDSSAIPSPVDFGAPREPLSRTAPPAPSPAIAPQRNELSAEQLQSALRAVLNQHNSTRDHATTAVSVEVPLQALFYPDILVPRLEALTSDEQLSLQSLGVAGDSLQDTVRSPQLAAAARWLSQILRTNAPIPLIQSLGFSAPEGSPASPANFATALDALFAALIALDSTKTDDS